MKLLIFGFLLFKTAAVWATNSTLPCNSLLSRSGRVVLIEADPTQPSQTKPFTQATQVVSSVAVTASVIATPSQIAQSGRSLALGSLVQCNNDSPMGDALAWTDNPLGLSIGDNDLADNLGAVVGNWAVFGGAAVVWTAITAQINPQTLKHPGGLIMPALALIEPTTRSSISLLIDGTTAQKIAGGFSITALVAGTSLVAVFLHPTNFKASWLNGEWADTTAPGYVQRFGMLFEDYKSGAQYFTSAELIMSAGTGLLRSLQSSNLDCRGITTAASALTSGYALATLLKKPHANHHAQIFYLTVSSIQALTMTVQTIAAWSAPQETLDKITQVTSNIMAATQWALFLKSLVDIAYFGKSLFSHFWAKPLEIAEPNLPTLADLVKEEEVEVIISRGETPVSLSSASSSSSLSDSFTLQPTEITGDILGASDEAAMLFDPYTGQPAELLREDSPTVEL